MFNSSVLSFDIDLNSVHCWSNISKIVSYKYPGLSNEAKTSIRNHAIILIEVASGISYGSGKKGEEVSRRKWAVYNSMMAGRIYEYASTYSPTSVVRVAPSHVWTCGYDEKTRQMLAGVSGDNHDIRECRAMQFFYYTNPNKWVEFEAYYASLSTKKGKAA